MNAMQKLIAILVMSIVSVSAIAADPYVVIRGDNGMRWGEAQHRPAWVLRWSIGVTIGVDASRIRVADEQTQGSMTMELFDKDGIVVDVSEIPEHNFDADPYFFSAEQCAKLELLFDKEADGSHAWRCENVLPDDTMTAKSVGGNCDVHKSLKPWTNYVEIARSQSGWKTKFYTVSDTKREAWDVIRSGDRYPTMPTHAELVPIQGWCDGTMRPTDDDVGTHALFQFKE